MKKQIATNAAPGAIGPYSQAISVGDFLFISGQIPVNPADGTVPEGIKAQTSQSIANIKAILAEAGMSMDNVIKTTVFLADMYGRTRHEPFRRHERGLRREFLITVPGTFSCGCKGTAKAGTRRDRDYRSKINQSDRRLHTSQHIGDNKSTSADEYGIAFAAIGEGFFIRFVHCCKGTSINPHSGRLAHKLIHRQRPVN